MIERAKKDPPPVFESLRDEQPEFIEITDFEKFAFGRTKHSRWRGQRSVEELATAFYEVLRRDESQCKIQPLKIIKFGDNPNDPYFRAKTAESDSLAVSFADGTEERLWSGPIQVPAKFGDTVFNIHFDYSEALGISGGFGAVYNDKYNDAIAALYDNIDNELQENSIYNGKPIGVVAGHWKYFLGNTSDASRDKIVYSERMQRELDAYLFNPIKQNPKSSLVGDENLNRSILLTGKYGTGKTSAAGMAAELCEQSGWTFIKADFSYGHDSMGVVESAMDAAKLYQPAVVYVEDFDTMASKIDEGSKTDSAVLELLDGLGAKSGDNTILILTANSPKRIPSGWLRPGRVDKLIEFQNFDFDTFRKMFAVACPPDKLPEISYRDYRKLYRAFGDLPPAFVRHVIDDTMLMTGDKLVSAGDFLASANSPSLRTHVDLATYDESKNTKKNPYSDLVKTLGKLYDKIRRVDYVDD